MNFEWFIIGLQSTTQILQKIPTFDYEPSTPANWVLPTYIVRKIWTSHGEKLRKNIAKPV